MNASLQINDTSIGEYWSMLHRTEGNWTDSVWCETDRPVFLVQGPAIGRVEAATFQHGGIQRIESNAIDWAGRSNDQFFQRVYLKLQAVSRRDCNQSTLTQTHNWYLYKTLPAADIRFSAMKNTKMKNEAGNKSKPNKVETSQISQILETVGDLLNDTVLSFSLSFFISSFLSLSHRLHN